MGGKKFVTIQGSDLTSLSIRHDELSRSEIGASSYRGLLFLNHGSSGILYRVGENVIVCGGDGEQLLLNVKGFLSVSQGSQHDNLLEEHYMKSLMN